MNKNQQQIDAYRYFFPAGWLLGIWGVLLWILFPWNLVTYPGLSHPEIMTGGFFLCFVCGFLMTAAPRFTSSFGPTRIDHWISCFLIALLFVGLSTPKIFFYGVVVLIFVFLISYLVRRFLNRSSNPPDSFVFVGVGLAAGLMGSLILVAAEVFNVPRELYNLGRLFFLQAYILCLVVGVGSRLIPALLGWAPMPTEQAKTFNPKRYLCLAILFLATYALEAFGFTVLSQLSRALIFSFIFLRMWKIYRLPSRTAVQTYWLWISAWLVMLGQWGIVAMPDFRVHLLHVILVSGLGLMTFMIAVRVGLSHGRHDMTLEKSSKMLALGAFLMCLAGFTRLSAGIAPALYQSHLIYAAYTWILGLLIWGWVFLPKMVRVK
ncbi:hypothetical protein DOM22_06520 [Bdellovibrio sp. ZAP7]|nr:hypothetical protein DOM22_06520 [Bdellovibrio sp. ZAP7]